jgi:chemotaxis protein histidine kinase CheA
VQELFASLIKDFVEETGPLARQVATLVLRLEEARGNGEDGKESLHAMKSALHTIKGNAAMMGFAQHERPDQRHAGRHHRTEARRRNRGQGD